MPFRIPPFKFSNFLFLISQFTTAADASSKTIIWSGELIWTLCQGLIFSFSPQAPRGWGSRFYSQKQVCENEYKGGGKLKSDFEKMHKREHFWPGSWNLISGSECFRDHRLIIAPQLSLTHQPITQHQTWKPSAQFLIRGSRMCEHMGEIALDVYFPQILSLFLQFWHLFSSTFCIGSIVFIISMGQSPVPESGKPSFWPVTSGKVLENNFQTWTILRFLATLSPFVYQVVCFRIDLKPSNK